MPLLLPRRSFLTGLASLFAAPAIVRASSLMPVGNIDHILYPMRGLIAYNIGTDSLMIRVDRANFKLPIPRLGITGILTDEQIKKVFTKEQLDQLIPKEPNQQKYIHTILNMKIVNHIGLNITNFTEPELTYHIPT